MDVSEVKNAPIATPEHMLGNGSMMPFNCTNSGMRKLMFGVNLPQRLTLIDPDVPYVQTGFENQYGEYSSSFEISDDNYSVIAKIPKFSSSPNSHFFILLIDSKGTTMRVVERISYKHVTESYGYLYDNANLDYLRVGDHIFKGEVIHKSTAFDEYNNRKDGKNLLLCFNASEQSMEDGIIISESCAKKLASPLIHNVRVIVNDNDIPLNLYGDIDNYKIFPDIGEEIKEGMLCAMRREKKEESLFSQSFSRLMSCTISDEKIRVNGKVIDINVYCNAPDHLMDNPYCGQIKKYYDDHIAFCHQIVDAVNPYLQNGIRMDYELQKLYHNCLDELNGKQFFSERAFSNITMDITVMETIPVHAGDKLTNRYGGKGVVSVVKADHLMPKTYDGQTIDIQANMCGIYGRENVGQLFELSCNFISMNIAKAMNDDMISLEECVQMYLDYLEIVSPKMKEEVENFLETHTDDDVAFYMSSIAEDGMIYLDIDPVSENMTIDKLAEIYKRFPWIKQEKLIMPLEDSNGNIRYISSRRPLVYGYVYYYRLKQHGEEKFSVTSLSATNIKNENSRNKASKVYKAKFSRTPIRFGDMEIGNMLHMGSDLVVQILMLYSASPQARMLCEQMITGDPFKVDVKLDDTSANRNIEILNTYLKTIGLRLSFTKKKKIKNIPILTSPVIFSPHPSKLYEPVKFYHPDEVPDPDDIKRLLSKYYHPITFDPIIFERDPETLDPSEYMRKITAKDKE